MLNNLLSILLFMPTEEGGEGGGFMQFLPLLLIIVVFYLFFIRPQMKKSKDQKKFRESLKKGDKVVTIGGIHGRILELKETTAIIEVGNQIKMTLERSAIAMDNTSQLGEKK
ncbi:MAG: preprotein translocase subunit YajC [Bacteroidota bacterium]|nr:preprotein translocase subunit YajC [Bacteroidota bacterium]